MALKREGPEFDHDDEVLLLKPGIMLDKSFTDEQPSSRAAPKVTTSFSPKQHKRIDHTRALDTTQLYFNKVGFSPLLTSEGRVHLVHLAQKSDPAGRRRMIESNLQLVVKVAQCYINRGLSLPDLVEGGNLGLICVVEKSDPERGFRFSTHTTWWIRRTTEWTTMNQAQTIRLPIHAVKKLNAYLCAARELTHKLGHEPSPEGVANLLEKPVIEIKRVLDLNKWVTSVDVSFSPGSDKILLDTLIDDRLTDPYELLQDDDLSGSIDQWLAELTDRQHEVVIRRSSLRGHENNTLEEVGQEIGLIRERARQIQVKALKRLREILEKNGLPSDTLFQ